MKTIIKRRPNRTVTFQPNAVAALILERLRAAGFKVSEKINEAIEASGEQLCARWPSGSGS